MLSRITLDSFSNRYVVLRKYLLSSLFYFDTSKIDFCMQKFFMTFSCCWKVFIRITWSLTKITWSLTWSLTKSSFLHELIKWALTPKPIRISIFTFCIPAIIHFASFFKTNIFLIYKKIEEMCLICSLSFSSLVVLVALLVYRKGKLCTLRKKTELSVINSSRFFLVDFWQCLLIEYFSVKDFVKLKKR